MMRTHETPVETISEAVFEEFLEAVSNNNIALVKAQLIQFPHLAFKPAEQGWTSLHFALNNNLLDMSKLLLAHIFFYHRACEDNAIKFLTSYDEKGYNLLHIAASYCHADCLELLVNALGPHAYVLAKQPRKSKEEADLPISYVESNKTPTIEAVHKIFQKITLEPKAKPIQQAVHFSDIPTDYYINNPTLAFNLEIACFAANWVRKRIDFSSTHPINNELNHEDFMKCIQIVRNRKEQENLSIKAQGSMTVLEQSEHTIKFNAATKGANCRQFSWSMPYLLDQIGYQNNIQIARIVNGDHTFCIIGCNDDQASGDYQSWGESAVVLDAWAGEVYPAYLFPKKISSFYGYSYEDEDENKDVLMNYTFQIDPDYLNISITNSQPSNTALPYKSINAKLFDEEERKAIEVLRNKQDDLISSSKRKRLHAFFQPAPAVCSDNNNKKFKVEIW